jgi:dynein light intermediate chain 1
VPAGVQKTPDRKVLGSPGVQGSPKKMDVTPGKALGANTSEGVLANFFNSLLSKKTGAGGVSPAGPGLPPGARSGVSPQPDDYKAAVRSDAAAELDRLTRNQKKSMSSPNNSLDGHNSASDC